jgi:hypothetical protein
LSEQSSPHGRELCLIGSNRPLTPITGGTFHSAAALAFAGAGLKNLWDWEPQTEAQKWLRAFGIGFLGGFATHLVMDGVTPKSLLLV